MTYPLIKTSTAKCISLWVVLSLLPSIALAQSNTGVWAWLEFITTKMPVLKSLIIWLAFIFGLWMCMSAGLTANKIAKGRPGEGDTWAAVAIKGGFGAMLCFLLVLVGGLFSGITGQAAQNLSLWVNTLQTYS